jgi:hypothetical protein
LLVFVIFVAFVPEREAVGRFSRYFLFRISTPETGPRHVFPE